jgi:hypothetical protein
MDGLLFPNRRQQDEGAMRYYSLKNPALLAAVQAHPLLGFVKRLERAI